MKYSIPISSLLHHKSPALWSIAPDATVFEAIKLMADKNIGALLVMSDGKLVGLVYRARLRPQDRVAGQVVQGNARAGDFYRRGYHRQTA